MTIGPSFRSDEVFDRSTRTVLDALPQPAWGATPAGRWIFINRAFRDYVGKNEMRGTAWLGFVHPDDRIATQAAWTAALLAGSAFEIDYRLRGADGAYRWFKAAANAHRDDDASISSWFGTCSDIDDYKRAETALRFVADIGEKLAGTLDGRAAVAMLAKLCSATLADACVVLLNTGSTDIVAAAHRDPLVVNEMCAFFSDTPLNERPVAQRVLFGGEGEVIPSHPVDAFRCAMTDDARARALRFECLSTIVVPLRARGRTLGVMYLMNDAGSRAFNDSDRALALDVARRAAIALTNAEAYAREHTIADTFQRAMLPARLPTIPGLTLSAEYVAAATEALVGGDWYDAFELADGRLLISTGDVTGRGLDAAVTMGRLRESLGVLSLLETDPARLLDLIDRALRRTNPDAIVTAVVGIVDTIAGTFTYASAGHPSPIVRTRDSMVTTLPARGLPLGLRGSSEPPSATVALPAGATIVLYTDGLTESTRDIDEGESRVAAAIADARIAGHPDAAAQIRRSVLGDRTRDDVAVLVVTLDAESAPDNAWSMRWTFDASDARFAHDVRELLIRFLRTRGTPDADYDGVGLIFGELIGNVVRHAPGRVDIELDWSGDRPVLIVDDYGPGFDPIDVPAADALAESGRGLFLIDTLSEAVDHSRRAPGGMRARVVLPVALP